MGDQSMPGHCKVRCRIGATLVLTVLAFVSAGALRAAGQTAVTTYHFDNYRTGWNQKETVLTPANVASLRVRLIMVFPYE